ncbi:MAG: HlyC/CorC family transporter [Proteobacteria bacterium]|nr:HlyC/CorC family transporter [Pseudomonadota bacterium]
MDTPIILSDWHTWIYPLCIFIACLPFVVICTTSARALSTLGIARAKHLVDEGHKKLESFVRHPYDYWITLHFLEVASVVGMFWTGYILLSIPELHLQSWVIWLILAGIYFAFHTALGGICARGDERIIAGRMLTILRPFCALFKPVSWIVTKIAAPFVKPPDEKFSDAERIEEELEVMLDESTRLGGLEDVKSRIMKSAIDYSETTVREVMIPRTELTACSVDTPLNEALELFIKESYSRLPVYDGNIDTIVGVLYFKDLVEKFYAMRSRQEALEKTTIKSLVREAFFVPETNHIDAIFEDFKREHIHMAIVVDEFGGTAGLVTLEDIVEEFFGEIQDEYDSEERTIVPIDAEQDIVLVDARTNISEIAEHFDIELEENPDYESIGGLVTYQLGRVGVVGDEVDAEGLHFVVRQANERCILKIEISRSVAETDDKA